MAEQGHLGENEDKFQKFESKTDEVITLLDSMMDGNGDLTMSSTSEPKDTLNIDTKDSLSEKYNQFE